MALFKIFKGNAAQLPALKTEGYMYITQDNGDIYVDISGTERKQLNANYANKLRDSDNITQLLNLGDANQAVHFVNGIPVLSREHVNLETTQNIGGNKYFTANHIGFINGGETDKFFDFAYSNDPTKSTAPGASWRIGALNSGSGNTNYFVIQTGGSDTAATTWNNAIRIGMNDLNTTFAGSILPLVDNSKTIGNALLRWSAIHACEYHLDGDSYGVKFSLEALTADRIAFFPDITGIIVVKEVKKSTGQTTPGIMN